MTDIEQARDLLREVMTFGQRTHYAAGRPVDVTEAQALTAIIAALRAAPEREFRDPDDLAEYLGSLVSNDEEWDAAQAAMWGVRAFQGDATVQERLQAAIEGECSGLAITAEQAAAILHYVLQPLYYAEREPTPQVKSCGGCGNADPERRCIGCGHDFAGPQLSNVTPPRDLRTKLGDA